MRSTSKSVGALKLVALLSATLLFGGIFSGCEIAKRGGKQIGEGAVRGAVEEGKKIVEEHRDELPDWAENVLVAIGLLTAGGGAVVATQKVKASKPGEVFGG